VKFDHQEYYDLLGQVMPDVVLSHIPPKFLCDNMFNGQNVGSPALTKHIQDSSPKLVMCGHIHEAGPLGGNPHEVKGMAMKDGTVVVNPGNLGRFELVNFPSLETARSFDYGTFSRVELEEDGSPLKVEHYTLSSPENTFGEVIELAEYDLGR